MANKIIKFQDYIEDVMVRLGCNETELAKKLGKTQPTVNRFRKGTAFPSFDTCWKLAHLTGDRIEKIVLIAEESKAADPAMKSVWGHIIKTMTKAGVFTLAVLLFVMVWNGSASASTGVTALPHADGASDGFWILCQIRRALRSIWKSLKNALIPPFPDNTWGVAA